VPPKSMPSTTGDGEEVALGCDLIGDTSMDVYRFAGC
jgi:hypothetical protein